MDWPGAASPEPGWPIGKRNSSVVSYLRKQSVRYLIYDYRYSSWNDAQNCASLEQPRLYSTELYLLLWTSILADRQFENLRMAYQSIYDDGQIAIIDIDRPIATAPPEESVWTLTTDKDRMCSQLMARYLAKPLSKNVE